MSCKKRSTFGAPQGVSTPGMFGTPRGLAALMPPPPLLLPSPPGPLGYSGVLGAAPPQRPPQEVRKMVLGLTAKNLQPGQQVVVMAYPQMLFRPEKLVVAQPDAVVHGLRIGNRQQLVGDVSGAAFGPGALGSLSCDTARGGQEIALTVSLPNGGDFSASLFGGAGGGTDIPFVDAPPRPPSPIEEEALVAKKEEEERYEPGVTIDELRDAGWTIPEEE